MNGITLLISSLLFGICILLVGTQNPIHSILLLILVFFLGSLLFFFFNIEYFALLFLIVYVGAIVVLFLFIVMMLEIKMINFSERIKDLFSFQNIILAFLLVQVLNYADEDFTRIYSFWDFFENNLISLYISEGNLFMDYSKVLQRTDHLRAIGGVLFTHYTTGILIAGLLLFLSMIGSIVMSLEYTKVENENSKYKEILKKQDGSLQALSSPTL